jgi:hypothetical protein
MVDGELTLTQIFAAATEVMESSGFNRVADSLVQTPADQNLRVFEDDYCIVGVAAFETWAELSAKWMGSQETLVGLISRHLVRSEPKSWEGYLVLMTPSVVPSSSHTEAEEIRYDISHVRKILATGDDIQSIGGVEATLLPLLPLSEKEIPLGQGEALEEILPALLADQHGVPDGAVRALINAFREHRSLMEALHGYLSGK